jgi:hypothetical protein
MAQTREAGTSRIDVDVPFSSVPIVRDQVLGSDVIRCSPFTL